MTKKSTDIENIIKVILIELNITYKKEYKIGRYPVDFYLPEYKLSIQCDGCFHHYCKKCYTKKVKHYPRQVFQKYRDRACIAYHKYNKISIIRLKECDIKKSPNKIKNNILSIIRKIKNGEIIYEY